MEEQYPKHHRQAKVAFGYRHYFYICFSNAVLSQQCYNRPNCVGDVLSVPTTAKECCVETDDGMSFGDSSGTCTVSQCIGN